MFNLIFKKIVCFFLVCTFLTFVNGTAYPRDNNNELNKRGNIIKRLGSFEEISKENLKKIDGGFLCCYNKPKFPVRYGIRPKPFCNGQVCCFFTVLSIGAVILSGLVVITGIVVYASTNTKKWHDRIELGKNMNFNNTFSKLKLVGFGSSGQCNTSYNFSIGVLKFNVFLGLSFNSNATSFNLS